MSDYPKWLENTTEGRPYVPPYEPPTLEGRTMRDLGQQLAQQRKVSAETVARLTAENERPHHALAAAWQECATLRSGVINAYETLAVWTAADGDDGPAWMRTLRDNLGGYVRGATGPACEECHGTGTSGERASDGAPLVCGCRIAPRPSHAAGGASTP